MARRVFFSFHYKPDNWRASQVRNIGAIEGNRAVSDNEWESISKGGDTPIKKWIDSQLHGRSCAVVLIGSDTAGRKWINYEISTAWTLGKGVLGIYIHNLEDRNGKQSRKGSNPFDCLVFEGSRTELSSVVKAYDPPYSKGTDVYAYIKKHIEKWVDEAVAVRRSH